MATRLGPQFQASMIPRPTPKPEPKPELKTYKFRIDIRNGRMTATLDVALKSYTPLDSRHAAEYATREYPGGEIVNIRMMKR